jgi:hypothetical protein
MRTPLIDDLPPDTPVLQDFDAVVSNAADTQEWNNLKTNSRKCYLRRYRRYKEWCSTVAGYQRDPLFITTERIVEYTQYMITKERYMPTTIMQALRALSIFASSAGKEVSREPAAEILALWRAKLRELEIIPPGAQSRRGTHQVG